MRTLATDDALRADLGERARMRAALLTWERAAQQALAVLREAAA
jgi:glycosyltransferase involved in cell wall biosynthesis